MSNVLFDAPGPRARARHRVGTAVGSVFVVGLLAVVVWKLYAEETITADKWEPLVAPGVVPALFEGLLITLSIAAVAILLAVLFGAVFALGRLSHRIWLRLPAIAITEFFRAVPVLLLIFFLFIGFGDALGTYWSVALALMLYNGSVLAEVFRAGVLAVPRGQSEAGYAIGLSKSQVTVSILAPQAVRTMLPAIISQCVVALKDVALGGFVVGLADIVDIGNQIYVDFANNNPIPVAIVLAAVFIVINYSLSKLAVWLERRLSRSGATPVRAAEGEAMASGTAG